MNMGFAFTHLTKVDCYSKYYILKTFYVYILSLVLLII